MDKSEVYWDKAANIYDKAEKKDEQTYTNIIRKTKMYLKTNDIVLDYGCGTGLICNEIASSVKAIHGLDISSKMLESASKKANERGISNISYIHSSIFDERYQNEAFDVILAFYVLHLVEDDYIVIQRINKLLKPGGLFISATPCMGEKALLNKLLILAGRVGLVPKIKSYRINNLVSFIEKENFSVVETSCLKESSQEYFVVFRKNP